MAELAYVIIKDRLKKRKGHKLHVEIMMQKGWD